MLTSLPCCCGEREDAWQLTSPPPLRIFFPHSVRTDARRGKGPASGWKLSHLVRIENIPTTQKKTSGRPPGETAQQGKVFPPSLMTCIQASGPEQQKRRTDSHCPLISTDVAWHTLMHTYIQTYTHIIIAIIILCNTYVCNIYNTHIAIKN